MSELLATMLVQEREGVAAHYVPPCEVDAELFFPRREMKDGHPTAAARLAIALCDTCPIQFDCLAAALEQDELFGIWGGKTTKERERMKAVMQ